MRTLPAYVTPAELTPSLPEQWVTEASDDDSDGAGETIFVVCDAASDTVDSYLQGRYGLPVTDSTALAKLREAARVRALWLLYMRRGKSGESNPWEGEWTRWAKKLEDIESGKTELIISPPATLHSPPKIGVVSRPMKTVRRGGGNVV